jgi:hypothetical protein
MHFATAHNVPKPTLLSVTAASLYLALFFAVAALMQLFAFESFPDVIASYDISFVSDLSPVVAALIVCLEVLALPFLLWMKVSRLMRVVSFISGWFVLLFWLKVGIWQSVTTVYISNAGLFGAKIVVPQGWWLVSYSAILIILMGYVTWHTVSRGKLLMKKVS